MSLEMVPTFLSSRDQCKMLSVGHQPSEKLPTSATESDKLYHVSFRLLSGHFSLEDVSSSTDPVRLLGYSSSGGVSGALVPLLFAFFLSVFHVCEPIEWGGKECFRERERVRKQKLVNLSISTISVTFRNGNNARRRHYQHSRNSGFFLPTVYLCP